MDILKDIEILKGNIANHDNELNRLKNEFLVNKTKFNQYNEEKEALLKEMKDNGFEVENLNESLKNLLKESYSLEEKIKEMLYTEKYNVKADIDIPEKSIELQEKSIDWGNTQVSSEGNVW